MPTTPRLDRRALFSLAGASVLSRPDLVRLSPAPATTDPIAGTTLAMPIHDAGPALDVAGPRDGDLAAWARRLAAPLAVGLMERGRLALRYGGGVDGVTGTNQFDARAAPDGREALLFPGSVALAWLAGLRPVRFDPARLMPLLAVRGQGVLMVRGGLPAPGATLRLAAGPRQEDALVALLGLDLLGIPAIRAARDSEANAVFLTGPQAVLRTPGLIGSGYAALLSTDGGPAPSFLAALPDARLRQDELVAAWRALAAASALCAVLVLPRHCPAAAVGSWRRAASAGLADEGMGIQARRLSLNVVADGDAAGALTPLCLASGPRMVLQRWLSGRADLRLG